MKVYITYSRGPFGGPVAAYASLEGAQATIPEARWLKTDDSWWTNINTDTEFGTIQAFEVIE